MELSYFLAQVFGILYLAVAAGLLVDPERYKLIVEDYFEDHSLLYFGGAMALVAGFSIVTFHNVWDGSWAVLITIIGWMAFLKGLILLIKPDIMLNLAQKMVAHNVTLYVTLILGGLLTYFGFFA